MKVQKYTCWLSEITEPTDEDKFTYRTSSPEAAAEFFCEDVDLDSYVTEVDVDVQAEDGTVYGVTVEAVYSRRFLSGRAEKN